MTNESLTYKDANLMFDYDSRSGCLSRKSCKLTGSVDEGYIRVMVDYRSYYAHRVIWLIVTGEWPDRIDHINGDRSDNRFKNLRSVNSSDNSKNQKKSAKNTTGIMGLYRQSKKWRVRIKANGKFISLGYFDNYFEACCVRKSAEVKYGYHANHGRAI